MGNRTDRILGIRITTYANGCVGLRAQQYIAKSGTICAKMEHKNYAFHVVSAGMCIQGVFGGDGEPVNLRGRSGTVCAK